MGSLRQAGAAGLSASPPPSATPWRTGPRGASPCPCRPLRPCRGQVRQSATPPGRRRRGTNRRPGTPSSPSVGAGNESPRWALPKDAAVGRRVADAACPRPARRARSFPVEAGPRRRTLSPLAFGRLGLREVRLPTPWHTPPAPRETNLRPIPARSAPPAHPWAKPSAMRYDSSVFPAGRAGRGRRQGPWPGSPKRPRLPPKASCGYFRPSAGGGMGVLLVANHMETLT
jgi:hypothetical protein